VNVSLSESRPAGDSRRKVRARVALALLETLQRQDLPDEVLVDENLSVTLPRRLGLSHVVDAQVRRYREEARRNRRVPEPEVVDLMRLVARRPDAAQVFLQVGRQLASDLPMRWRAVLPGGIALRLARRRSTRVLRDLFGGPVVSVSRKDGRLELSPEVFRTEDAPGEVCALLTGVIEGVAASSGRGPYRVRHTSCRALAGPACAWELDEHRPELVPAQASEGPLSVEGLEGGTSDPGAPGPGGEALTA
jgi:hypothetical protein